jgi:hypothetical protein
VLKAQLNFESNCCCAFCNRLSGLPQRATLSGPASNGAGPARLQGREGFKCQRISARIAITSCSSGTTKSHGAVDSELVLFAHSPMHPFLCT